jgi:outer membrane lipoprotein-sorting protein
MNKHKYLVTCKILLFLLSLAGAFAFAADTSNCSTPGLLAKIKSNITEIKDYQLQSRVFLDGDLVRSNIVGKLPNNMRISMTINQGDATIKQSTTFDGSFQWLETKSPNAIEVSKIKLKDVVSPERPFDTSFYMMGSGLLNGEDYPTSVSILISVYDVVASCSKSHIKLSGPLNVDKFTRYVNTKKPTGPSSARVKQFAELFPKVNILFDINTLELKEYTLGTKKNPQYFKANFYNAMFNRGLEKDAFAYTPPPGVSATDITKDLLENMQH